MVSPVTTEVSKGVIKVTWTGLASTNTATTVTAAVMPRYADRTIQVTATAYGGVTVNLLGSNDGTNFSTLTDPQGNTIAATGNKIEQVMENVTHFKPALSASATAAVDIDVVMVCRGDSR